MTKSTRQPIKLFQFPRMFAIPNLSPFCCKLETWLRIAGIAYEIVDTRDPRKGPRGKLPFIEDRGARLADSSLIVEHLVRTHGVDPDASLDEAQRAIALLVQRTLEEHYAFVLAYTHLFWEEGSRYTQSRFDAVPRIIRPFVARAVRRQVKNILWQQGILRHAHDDIMEAAIRDWRALLAVMSEGPFFFGEQPTGLDAIVFGALATTVLTPIESPIRHFLRSKPGVVAYAERMRTRFFPELAAAARSERSAASAGSVAQMGV
jgi:glutathione S-transferase